MKNNHVYLVVLMFAFCISGKAQNNAALPKDNAQTFLKDVSAFTGPTSITRNIIQDRRGNIWMASWQGVFRYDGNSFTNVTSEVSSARFFSILEDRKGNLWFGSIGSGVYYYDGYFFKNFTIKDGLLNDDVDCIYEDKRGNIWFGVFGGASCYNGKSFRNYIIEGDVMNEDHTGKTFKERPPFEVNSIIEDKTGKFWFGTRGSGFVYDARLNGEVGQGKAFTVFTNAGKPFTNVRCIIEDKKGTIWLGGNDGLWRYDGSIFTIVTTDFVGYIYEDRKGNIWTSSQTARGWALSRYDSKTLSKSTLLKPTVAEIYSSRKMVFGILETQDGSIWFGSLDGAYRYDGSRVTSVTVMSVR